MEKYNNIEKSWIATFESANPARMIQAVYEVRNSGSVNMIPVLFAQLNSKTDPRVKTEIIRLISELKTQNAAPIIAGQLAEHEYGDVLDEIVAACWQSGLDFSNHLKVFAALFAKGNYKTALEAFTVIEESIINATDKEVIEFRHYLTEIEKGINDEKMPLFIELKKVVQSY